MDKCGDCGGQGWYAVHQGFDPPEQVQCELCEGFGEILTPEEMGRYLQLCDILYGSV